MARSRSPRAAGRERNSGEWISRQVVSFGRYPEKRPGGLYADETGAFLLDDLVRVWGRHHSLKQEDILAAVTGHMFHDAKELGGGAAQLRFAVDGDGNGKILIRVMPKRGSERGSERGLDSPATCGTPVRSHRSSSYGLSQRPRGSVWSQMPQAKSRRMPRQAMMAAPVVSSAMTTEEKLAMSLDEIVREQRAPKPAVAAPVVYDLLDDDDDPPSAAKKPQTPASQELQASRHRIYRSLGQMGLTTDTKHLRKAPMKQNLPKGQGKCNGNQEASLGGDDRSSAGEQVSRWVSWVLRSGHRELNVTIEPAGWASLAEIAAAICRHRRRFGDFDAEKLSTLLMATEQAGRFEVKAGRIRKVSKEDRELEVAAHKLHATPEAGGIDAALGRRRRSRSRSRSSDAGYAEDPEADQALADACRKTLSVTEAANVEPEDPGAPAAQDGGAPPRPPGPNWTKYQDEGLLWWYYEGPLGKWWCSEGEPVKRFGEDAEDA